jgi:hypothetical protein
MSVQSDGAAGPGFSVASAAQAERAGVAVGVGPASLAAGVEAAGRSSFAGALARAGGAGGLAHAVTATKRRK